MFASVSSSTQEIHRLDRSDPGSGFTEIADFSHGQARIVADGSTLHSAYWDDFEVMYNNSADNGDNWGVSPVLITDSDCIPIDIKLGPVTGNFYVLMNCTGSTLLYRSVDNGANWTNVVVSSGNSEEERSLFVDANENIVVNVSYSGILYSTNNGASFTTLPGHSVFDGSYDVALHDGTVYLTYSAYGDPFTVQKTDDFGLNYETISYGAPEGSAPTPKFSYVSNDTLYIYQLVYGSSDSRFYRLEQNLSAFE